MRTSSVRAWTCRAWDGINICRRQACPGDSLVSAEAAGGGGLVDRAGDRHAAGSDWLALANYLHLHLLESWPTEREGAERVAAVASQMRGGTVPECRNAAAVPQPLFLGEAVVISWCGRVVNEARAMGICVYAAPRRSRACWCRGVVSGTCSTAGPRGDRVQIRLGQKDLTSEFWTTR